jgi:RHS repeat-associated protein
MALNEYLNFGDARGIRTKLTYNSFGEPITESATLGTTPLYSSTYTRDDLGRVTGITVTTDGLSTTKTFTFDSIGQLITESADGVSANDYTYDANGNRFTSNGNEIYDEQDRLVSNAEWEFTYNRNGFLIRKAHKITDAIAEFKYDNLGNLLQVKNSNGSTVEYTVDGLDRRIQRKVTNTVTDSYLYQDQLKPIAQLNEDGSIRASFVYGTRSNSPDLILKSGVTYRVIHDHLGSPIFVVDTRNNEVVQKMTYDTWGKILTDSNPGFQPFGFAGGLYDATTGLVRFGARDYDPSIGRWLNKDPIRFDGGWNFYAYVGNDPLNFIDPSGLSRIVLDPIGKTLDIYPDEGQAGPPQRFPGSNDTVRPNASPWLPEGNGPLPAGTFPTGNRIPTDQGVNGSLGNGGFIPIRLPAPEIGPTPRGGVGIHAGRRSSPRGPGMGTTQGCVRTTEEAMDALRNDPPKTITILPR